jgi:glycosyltransferase involved in cell wall biosynthesis
MNNRVSVVIPTYNRADLVPRAIRSVLAATSPGDEVLVVDDGSTDDTAAVVRQFGDPVRYVRIENSGPGAARNVGIRMARNPFLTFLDSDDTWVADKLELQRAVMERFPSVVFCFGNMLSTLLSGEIFHDVLSDWRPHPRIGSDTAPRLTEALGPPVRYSSFASLPSGRADFDVHVGDMYLAEMEACYVVSDTVMVNKELAGDAFRYPEDIRLMEDYECFARLSKVGPAAYLDCELADVLEHAGPRLTDADNVRHLQARIALMRRVYGADESFLRANSERYEDVLGSKTRLVVRLLLTTGRLEEARAALKDFGGPLSYRWIARLPPVIVDTILHLNRMRKRR